MSKGLSVSNIKIDGNMAEEEKGKFIVVPYLKETQKMFSEIGSIVLDVLRYGPDEVLKHIDSEESIKE
jgi:hypothetical protein